MDYILKDKLEEITSKKEPYPNTPVGSILQELLKKTYSICITI